MEHLNNDEERRLKIEKVTSYDDISNSDEEKKKRILTIVISSVLAIGTCMAVAYIKNTSTGPTALSTSAISGITAFLGAQIINLVKAMVPTIKKKTNSKDEVENIEEEINDSEVKRR